MSGVNGSLKYVDAGYGDDEFNDLCAKSDCDVDGIPIPHSAIVVSHNSISSPVSSRFSTPLKQSSSLSYILSFPYPSSVLPSLDSNDDTDLIWTSPSKKPTDSSDPSNPVRKLIRSYSGTISSSTEGRF